MKRPDRRAVGHWSKTIALLVLIAFVWYSGELQKARIDALANALTTEQQATENRGETPVAPDPQDLIQDPEAEAPAGPTREELDEAVHDAVEAYFRENPLPDNATAAEIAAGIASAVADYIADNPEATAPSREQLAAAAEVAVTAYLAEHPPADGNNGTDGATGPPGPQGDPGPAPTREALIAAVQAYIAENPIPVCLPGYAPEERTLIATDGPVDSMPCVKQPE